MIKIKTVDKKTYIPLYVGKNTKKKLIIKIHLEK